MKGKISNDGKRALTTKLNTFAVLSEEKEILRQAATRVERERQEAERRERELHWMKAEAEKLKDMEWADIEDEDDLGHDDHTHDVHDANHPHSQEDSDDEGAPVVIMSVPKNAAAAKKKGKSEGMMDDLDNVLAALKTSGAKKPQVQASDAEKQKAEAVAKLKQLELRAKVAAATKREEDTSGSKEGGKNGEKRKMTKAEKKEFKKQYQR